MNLFVMSQATAEMYTKTEVGQQACYISITSPNQPKADLTPVPEENILRLQFDDADSGKNAITMLDARKILDFVQVDDIKVLVVHCGAGVSRSAGVAAALAEIFWGTSQQFFERYVPNRLCYRTVLTAAHEDE